MMTKEYYHDGINITRLFQAVLGQAFFDACKPIKTARNKPGKYHESQGTVRADKIRAQAYLLKPSKDLDMVCTIADRDMSDVIKKAQELQANEWPAIIKKNDKRTKRNDKRDNF